MATDGWLANAGAAAGLWWSGLAVLMAAGTLAAMALPSERVETATVLDVWGKIKAPPPPIEPVRLVADTTALLILDIEERTTNRKRRPRAVASVPRIAGLPARARAAGMPVVYSLTSKGTRRTILKEVTPRKRERVVKSSVDKFYGTQLETLLKKRGVKTVLIVGTSAEGAVLHTATGAAMRGFDVVVPIDGMSSSEMYAEQYTAWHLVNAPGTRRRTRLTRIDMIQIGAK